ncbi:MAG: DUF6567 family protein [Verrucomicrobiota bacterium]
MEGTSLLRVGMVGSICLLLAGCAAVAPFTSSLTGGGAPAGSLDIRSQTTITLQEGNFITLRTNVVGRSKGFKLLGFITLRPATLDEAMGQLYMDAQAQHNRPQTLANLIVEHSGIYVILFSIPKVTARADLVEFVPRAKESEPKAAPH